MNRYMSYDVNLTSLKLIPLAPKVCKGKESWIFYPVSERAVFFTYDFETEGFPYATSYYIRMR